MLWGCSNDSNSPESILPENIIVVSQFGRDIRIGEVNVSNEVVFTQNYSQQFIDSRGRRYQNYVDNQVIYIYSVFPKIYYWSYDFNTLEIKSEPLYNISSNEYVFDAISDGKNAYLTVDRFFEGETISRDVLIINLENPSLSKRTPITKTKNLQFGAEYLYTNEEALFLYSTNQTQESLVYKIDIDTGEKIDSLFFSQEPVIVAKEGSLFAFSPNNKLRIYSQKDLSLVKSYDFQFDLVVNPRGFKSGFVSNNIVVTDFIFAQPFPVISSPVEVNFSSNTIITQDPTYLLQLLEEFESQNGFSIEITSYTVNLSNKLIVFGYESNAELSLGNIGGLVYSNFEGDLLGNIELDLIPTDIYLPNN